MRITLDLMEPFAGVFDYDGISCARSTRPRFGEDSANVRRVCGSKIEHYRAKSYNGAPLRVKIMNTYVIEIAL